MGFDGMDNALQAWEVTYAEDIRSKVRDSQFLFADGLKHHQKSSNLSFQKYADNIHLPSVFCSISYHKSRVELFSLQDESLIHRQLQNSAGKTTSVNDLIESEITNLRKLLHIGINSTAASNVSTSTAAFDNSSKKQAILSPAAENKSTTVSSASGSSFLKILCSVFFKSSHVSPASSTPVDETDKEENITDQTLVPNCGYDTMYSTTIGAVERDNLDDFEIDKNELISLILQTTRKEKRTIDFVRRREKRVPPALIC
jgi:hypothetical protein